MCEPVKLRVDIKQRKQTVQTIAYSETIAYKTKNSSSDFYTEVNPVHLRAYLLKV